MMNEHLSPSSNKKRKSAVALPSQKRLLVKKTKITEDLTGTCALSQSPSKISFNSSPTSPNQTTRIPSKKNKAGPSTSTNAASHGRDLAIPTRMSLRVSRPTFKKRATLATKSRSSESDGTPPLSIIPLPPSSLLKKKKSTSSPTKRLAGNNTPSKPKRIDPNTIEITSSDDGNRPQPPRKRVKHTHKKPFRSEVIDLCSESEDVIVSPTCTRERSVVVLSTDEEVDLELPASSHLVFRKIDTRESPALPPPRDISSPIEIESVFQASPSPQAHNTPVPKPKPPVSEEDGVTDETSIHAEKVSLPRGSLQVLYNEALARCTRETRREKVADRLSPFSSLKCVPPARIIRYATQTQTPSLHTPLFFSRIIFRLRARRKQPKTLDAKPFSDVRASFSNPKAFPAISDDTGLNAVDSKALEIATKTVLMPPIDFQDDTSSDTQVASVSSSILVSNMDVNERLVSQSLGSSSPLPNHESLLRLEVTIPEALQRKYDASKIYGISALELNDTAKSSAAFEPLSELPTECATITPSVAISSSVYTSSATKCLPRLSMEQAMVLNLSSPAGPSSKDVSSGLECLSESPTIPNLPPLTSPSSAHTISSRASSPSPYSCQSLDSSATIESVSHLLTPGDSPTPFTPLAKAQKRESLICSNPFPSPIDVSLFDIDMSELSLQTIMSNMSGENDDDDDDDISTSGMEFAYPEELHTI